MRAFRLIQEKETNYETRSACVHSISAKIGCSPQTLWNWINKQAIAKGTREVLTQSERDELRSYQRKNRALRQANDILRKASAFFAAADLERLTEEMIMFIDEHQKAIGVEAICRVLPIAPSTYYHHKMI